MRRDQLLRAGTYSACPDAVLARADLTATAKLVYIALAKHLRGPAETVYPSIPRLATLTGSSRGAVKNAIAALEAGVWISAHRQRGKATLYGFCDPTRSDSDLPIPAEDPARICPTSGQNKADTGPEYDLPPAQDPARICPTSGQNKADTGPEYDLPPAQDPATICPTPGQNIADTRPEYDLPPTEDPATICPTPGQNIADTRPEYDLPPAQDPATICPTPGQNIADTRPDSDPEALKETLKETFPPQPPRGPERAVDFQQLIAKIQTAYGQVHAGRKLPAKWRRRLHREYDHGDPGILAEIDANAIQAAEAFRAQRRLATLGAGTVLLYLAERARAETAKRRTDAQAAEAASRTAHDRSTERAATKAAAAEYFAALDTDSQAAYRLAATDNRFCPDDPAAREALAMQLALADRKATPLQETA